MTQQRGKSGLLANLLLAALLVAGQASATLHAYEHDLGTPQGKVCPDCVTAAQLDVAAVDNPAAEILEPTRVAEVTVFSPSVQSRHVHVARQRGPPAPL